MLQKKLDAICVGAAVVDIPLRPVNQDIFQTESYPLDDISMVVGGDAINESIILSRLGHKTALMTLVGNDASGDFIIKSCLDNNVDSQSVKKSDLIRTSINVGLVREDGERTFLTNRNGSLWKMTSNDIDTERFAQARLLSLASIFNNPLLDGLTLESLFQEAKKTDMILCADMIMPRLGETLDDIKKALSYLDYFFPNYEEAALLTQERDVRKIAEILLNCGTKNVIIKNGKKGCFVKNNEGEWAVSSDIVKPRDTIGAGDNFVAGFISGILENKPLLECAAFANVVAAISVQGIGATAGMQNRDQVEVAWQNYQEKRRS